MSFQGTALVLAWVAILLLALGFSGLLRHVHALAMTLEGRRVQLGPRIGQRAPTVEGENGGRSTRTRVLLFADTECPSCADAIEELEAAAAEDLAQTEYAVIFSGAAPPVDSTHLLVYPDQHQTFADFGIRATPFVVAIAPDGKISAAEPAGSSGAVSRFLASVNGGSE